MRDSSYESWDAQVQTAINLASDVPSIPTGGTALTYSYTNTADWLLKGDPLFKSGAPGYSYYTQMQNDLLLYSKKRIGLAGYPGAPGKIIDELY